MRRRELIKQSQRKAVCEVQSRCAVGRVVNIGAAVERGFCIYIHEARSGTVRIFHFAPHVHGS